MSVHTRQDTSPRRLRNNVLMSMLSVRQKRASKARRFLRNQLKTIKSCDLIFYLFLEKKACYDDILVVNLSQ